jgi:hypothetical protein
MGVRSEKLRALDADGSMAECRTFGGATHDTDVKRHFAYLSKVCSNDGKRDHE